MSKYKNLLLDELDPERFAPPVKRVVCLGKEPFTGAQTAFLETLKTRFPQAQITVSAKLPKTSCDFLAPLNFYPVSAPTRYPLELAALFSPADYLLIYEDTYRSVRLADKGDLIYRLFLRPLLWAGYMGFSLLLAGCFYLYYLASAPFAKKPPEKN